MKLDFDSVNYCVKQLREAADDCVEVGKSCKNKTNSTESTWKGKTADQFRNRMTKWSRETDKIGDELDAMACKILRVAKQMRERIAMRKILDEDDEQIIEFMQEVDLWKLEKKK